MDTVMFRIPESVREDRGNKDGVLTNTLFEGYEVAGDPKEL